MAEVGNLSVTLGLDTASFQRSIQDVNRKLKLAQSEFKAATAGVDGFENSVEGLRKKSDYLSKTLQLQKDKVETLRAQYEKLAQEKGENSKEAENMLIRLNKTIAAMKKTEAQLKETNAAIEEQTDVWSRLKKTLNEAGESFKKAGEKMKNAGQTLSTSVTLPIVGLGAAAIKTASDFDTAQAKIQGQLGLTAEEAEKLSDIAQEVWEKGFGESVDEVTTSLAILKQNMKDVAETDFQPLLQSAFTIRDLFGADIQETTATAGVLMKQFRIDGQAAMDLITVGFQRGGDFSGELLDTLREYAPQFAAMGFNAEQALSMLITGAEAGAFNLDKVGDAMKEFNIRMKDGSDLTAQALGELGFNVEDITSKFAQGGEEGQKAMQAVMLALSNIEDPLQRNQLGVALFGTQWEDLESDVITAMATSKTELENVEGATQKAGEALRDNFGTELKSTLRQLQDSLVPIGTVLIDILKQVLPHIQKFAEWFKNLSPTMQTVIVAVGGVVAALGPLLAIIAPIITAIGTLATTIGVSFGAIALATGGIVVGIAALIAIGVALWKNWDTIKAKSIEIWGAIQEWFSTTLESIKQFFSQTWNSIASATSEVWEGIKNFFAQWWDTLLIVFLGPIGWIVATIIKNWDTVLETTKIIFEMVKAIFTLAWTTIKDFLGPILTFIWNGIENTWEKIRNATQIVFNATKIVVKTIWEEIKKWIVNPVIFTYNIVKTKFEELKEKMVGPIESAKETIKETVEKIKSFFSGLELKIPKPKIPKISVEKGTKTIAGIEIPYPKFSVNWHKVGGVFTKPVIFGNAGFGDVEEAIVPFEGSHARKIAGLIAREMPQSGPQITIQNMTVRDETDIHKIARELHGLYLDSVRGV